MNERVKDEQLPGRIGPVVGPASESHRLDLHGVDVRIDGAHARPAEPELREVDWPALEHFVVAAPTAAQDAAEIFDVARFDTQFFDEAGQRFQQLQRQIQTQKASLAQREQALRSRQATYEEELARFSQRVADDQTQLDARRSQVQKNETLLAERLIAIEVQSRKLETEREALIQQHLELDRRRKTIRDESLADLHAERTELERARSTFRKEQEQLVLLKDALQQRLEGLAEEHGRLLNAEREKLWNSLTAEWEQRQTAFQQERDAWDQTRALEATGIDREKAMFESAVESANAEFVAARDALAIEFARLREQQAIQLKAEKDEWERVRLNGDSQLQVRREALQAEFLVAREALAAELAGMRVHHAGALLSEQEEWQQHRLGDEAQLEEKRSGFLLAKEALDLEIEQARNLFAATVQAERDAWEQTRGREESLLDGQRAELQTMREALVAELAQLREQHSATLHAERNAWEQTHSRQVLAIETQQVELEAMRTAVQREIAASREQLAESIDAERKSWDQKRRLELAELEAQQVEWLVARDSLMADSRDALELELKGLRDRHQADVESERRDWDEARGLEKSALETQQTELLRERTLIESRIRFQQEHLEKSRDELERAQNEHRRERQIERQRLEEAGLLMIRRLRQIDLYRSSIDAREKSLDREHEVLERTRQAISSTADLDRLNLQAERQGWEQERQIQRSELQRQQDALATRAENLESRRTRLDKLRGELEETHRATLEMRLAVEEAWAQLTDAAGQDDARERVEQVRQSLIGYYQQMHETLAEQRREHFEAQSKFERQRTEFTDERQKLTAWFTARDEELRQGEERLRSAAKDAATNHTKWLAARDRWLLEKTEAEHLIRRLLTSLGENNRDPSSELDALLHLNDTGVVRPEAATPHS